MCLSQGFIFAIPDNIYIYRLAINKGDRCFNLKQQNQKLRERSKIKTNRTETEKWLNQYLTTNFD